MYARTDATRFLDRLAVMLRTLCADPRGILALAHRGVIHVRGKDCVHPDIGRVIVRMISFPARESGQRARLVSGRPDRLVSPSLHNVPKVDVSDV